MSITVISSDYFNGVYEDGALVLSGRPDYVDAETLIETMIRKHPEASLYVMPSDVYDELLNGNDYPARIEDVPLERLHRIR